jgi:uncharacterized protein YceK
MRKLLVLMVMLNTVGGCKTIKHTFTGEDYRVGRMWWDSRDAWAPPVDCKSMLDLATYRFPEDVTPSEVMPEPEPCKRKVVASTKPSAKATDDKRRYKSDKGAATAYTKAKESAESRDRLQDRLLSLANRECERHQAAVIGLNSGANFSLAMLTSLFSGAATGFAAESTKTALAAISTFFGATRSHLNETIYRQLFVGTVLKAIDDDRQTTLLDIYDKRRYPVPGGMTADPRAEGQIIEPSAPKKQALTDEKKLATTDEKKPVVADERSKSEAPLKNAPFPTSRLHYGIDEAIRDADSYNERCSFYRGLVRVAESVERASPCAVVRTRRAQILDEITAINVTGNPTAFAEKAESLRKELSSLEAKLQSCIQSSQ